VCVNERNFELPGREGTDSRDKEVKKKERKLAVKKVDFSKQRQLIFNFKKSAISILFQSNSYFYHGIFKYLAFMSDC
jgi:hypothetical protein